MIVRQRLRCAERERVLLFCDTSIALLLYFLLRAVDDALSLLAAFFRLVFVAVQAIGIVLELSSLAVLKGALHASLTPGQAQALAALLLRLHSTGYVVALLFFAVHCLLIGALIARATLLPASSEPFSSLPVSVTS